jgi:hypothetical protein
MLAALRVAPVPATPLLTGCGRSDLRNYRDGTKNRAYPVRTKNRIKGSRPTGHGFTGWHYASGENEKRHSRGALGLLHGENGNDTVSVEKVMFDR